MSKRKILKPSLKTAKLSNKKGLFVPKNPPQPTFETAKLPDWIALVLCDLVNDPKHVPVLHVNPLPQLPAALGFVCNNLQDVLEDDDLKEQYSVYVYQGKERSLLDEYLQAYAANRLPTQHYKTFEKSLAATIKILTTAEQTKGRKFGLDGITLPASDVRFYSDLVYLCDKNLIELILPALWVVNKTGKIADVTVRLKVSAKSLASRVLPPPPDALYDDLQLFLDEKLLEYHGNKSPRMQTERPMCKILEYMMKHPQPVSLRTIRNKFGIVTTKNDPEARDKIDNFIFRVNLRLWRVKFPQQLGITAKKICWKFSSI